MFTILNNAINLGDGNFAFTLSTGISLSLFCLYYNRENVLNYLSNLFNTKVKKDVNIQTEAEEWEKVWRFMDEKTIDTNSNLSDNSDTITIKNVVEEEGDLINFISNSNPLPNVDLSNEIRDDLLTLSYLDIKLNQIRDRDGDKLYEYLLDNKDYLNMYVETDNFNSVLAQMIELFYF